MGDIRTSADAAFRDYVNGPATDSHEPVKSEIRATFGVVEDRIDSVEDIATIGVKWTANTIRVRSTANVVIASALENGDTLNGVTLATGNHVFLGSQTAPAENGLYTVVASGAASRATFADSAAELAYIGFVLSEGTAGAGERWTLPLAAASITVGSTALNFAKVGVEVSVSAEVAAARGEEDTLDDRISGISDKLDHAVVEVDVVDWSARTPYHRATVTTPASQTDAFGISGLSVAFGPAEMPDGDFNAIYLPPTFRSLTGVADSNRWRTIRAGVRTDATDASNPGTTQLAVGSVLVDPSEHPLRALHIPLTDPITGLPKTVTPAALAGLDWMIWWDALAEDGTKATFSESIGTISGLTRRQTYYMGTGQGPTDEWSEYSGNPSFAFGLALLTDPEITQAFPPRMDYSHAALALCRPERVNAAMMRRFRMFAAKRVSGVAARHHHALIGDSWSTTTGYFSAYLTDRLIARYGDGGIGWIGLGSTGGTVQGEARGDVIPVATGAWTYSYHAGGASPDLAHAQSTTAGDSYSIPLPASPARSAVKLITIPAVAGAARYRWGGGSWTALNTSSAATAPQVYTLAGDPGGAVTLEIETVSGTFKPAGLDVQSASSGIIVHKLGSSGSSAANWTAPTAADWQAGITALGIESASILTGTNDEAARVTPAEFKESLRTIITRLRAAVPGMDIALVMPPENQNGYETAMPDLSAAALELALEMRCTFCDLQPSFGDPYKPTEYGDGGAFPLFNADNTHPSDAGAHVIAEAQDRLLALS